MGFFFFLLNTGKGNISSVKEMPDLSIPCGATCDAESLPWDCLRDGVTRQKEGPSCIMGGVVPAISKVFCAGE